MKRIIVISLVVVIAVAIAGAVYAQGPWGGYGMGYGTGAKLENVRNFQKETLSLRDELITKTLELRDEYRKPVSDTNRVATLRKKIIDLQAKIQTAADKYGVSGPMGGMMMSSMMEMCPMGWW